VRPPRRQDIAVPRQGQPATAAAPGPSSTPAPRPAAAPSAPPRPAPRPRKPPRHPARPKLSQAALEGEAPLRTFSELKAYFDAQRHEAPAQVPTDQGESGASQ